MQLGKHSKPAKIFALMLSVTPAGCLTTTGSGGTDAPFCVVCSGDLLVQGRYAEDNCADQRTQRGGEVSLWLGMK